LPRRLDEAWARGQSIEAVIVVDDIAATGNTISRNVLRCVEKSGELLKRGKTKLIICSLYATKIAAEFILKSLKKIVDIEFDFRVGEFLSTKLSAFSEDSPIWANREERERAKALVTTLGAMIYRNQPLGFGALGLLLVFPSTVPNNSLPILHSASKSGQKTWRPLFQRPTN
jgi:hypothetical protein